MDYLVGSISDLITGSDTPNKAKVIAKKVSPKKLPEFKNVSPMKPPSTESFEDSPKKKNLRKRLNEFQTIEEPLEASPKEKKSKKTLNKSRKPRKFNNKSSKPGEVIKKKWEKLEDPPTSDIDHQAENLLDSENDDSEFEEKSEFDKNAERRVKEKEKKQKPPVDPEHASRTIFIGNLPITTDKKKLFKLFKEYGKIENVRIRGVAVADPKTPKKIAIIKNELNPKRKSFYAFARFFTREDAQNALKADKLIFENHHLKVVLCDDKEQQDESKAIFVGNLRFDTEDEQLWSTFEPCGPISSVRIIRDSITGMGKGFAYVNFENSDAVQLALEMQDVKLNDRQLRIQLCNLGAAKKNKKANTQKKIRKPGPPRRPKKPRRDDGTGEQDQQGSGNKTFQGVKFADKKKKKFDRGLQQKKKMIKQLGPKAQ